MCMCVLPLIWFGAQNAFAATPEITRFHHFSEEHIAAVRLREELEWDDVWLWGAGGLVPDGTTPQATFQ